jgi:hypothetical protein
MNETHMFIIRATGTGVRTEEEDDNHAIVALASQRSAVISTETHPGTNNERRIVNREPISTCAMNQPGRLGCSAYTATMMLIRCTYCQQKGSVFTLTELKQMSSWIMMKAQLGGQPLKPQGRNQSSRKTTRTWHETDPGKMV